MSGSGTVQNSVNLLFGCPKCTSVCNGHLQLMSHLNMQCSCLECLCHLKVHVSLYCSGHLQLMSHLNMQCSCLDCLSHLRQYQNHFHDSGIILTDCVLPSPITVEPLCATIKSRSMHSILYTHSSATAN